MRLARAGYGGGDPEKVLDMQAETVVTLLDYERFLPDWEAEFRRLNRREEGA